MKQDIKKAVLDAIDAVSFLKQNKSLSFIENAAKMIAKCFKGGNKIVIAGNGGSLCDAMHFAEEFTGYFRKKRKALPAIALSEPSHLTCVSNDAGFEFVFSRACEAYLQKDDIFISLTTSGNSKNIFNAIKVAKDKEAKTISFLGKTGGMVKDLSDLEIIIDGFATSDRIQEAHMTMIHIIIEMVEKQLFEPTALLKKLKDKALELS
ncbi:MAG: Phosphoheptose isomerase [Candidatus Anoxychlamydiales bacterium]|nr:Phosphoheptose isomerase [Candidatus Anoxychlamydiales bacterium]NGX36209.1 Phosphoheptose isomerase [Candidatus Anoxychlamydiales bacterium]